jgi:hypothetical protein
MALNGRFARFPRAAVSSSGVVSIPSEIDHDPPATAAYARRTVMKV